MGVRGLTSYIEANADCFLIPFELHDTNLVIDGDSLCVQLYQRSSHQTNLFGGNYDHFFHAVADFLELLRTCNVTPYVLLDGGYERCKLRTVKERMRSRLESVKDAQLGNSHLILPLMVREVFIEALSVANVKYMRCLFEADNEVASLAQKLNCPLLSYDSDFYIHNVKYIPFVTITHSVSRKEIAKRASKSKSSQIPCEPYNYLGCRLYTIKNLTGARKKLKKEMLPLFAVLLGNDQMDQQVFSKFYSTIEKDNINRRTHKHHRGIHNTLRWLQRQQSLSSAIETILSHVSEQLRGKVFGQIQSAMLGYRCRECVSFAYFGFKEKDHQLLDQNECNVPKNAVSIKSDSSSEESVKIPPVGDCDKAEHSSVSCDLDNEDDDDDNDEVQSEEDQQEETLPYREFIWEPWFLDLYRSAQVPRFFVDLYRFNRYLNFPQMEDTSKQDSNTICYPILRHIFALLMFSKKSTHFNYYTRRVNMTSFRYCKFTNVKLPTNVTYNQQDIKNLPLLHILFSEFDNDEQMFESLKTIPDNLQAYFLSIAYWAKQCTDVTMAHVYALVISILQLQIIDIHLETRSRDIKVFEKVYKAQLDTLRCTHENPTPPEIASVELTFNKKLFNILSNALTKPELLLTYAKLLPYFSTSAITTLDRLTLHTFAEFQSVVFNLNALMSLLRNPFDNVRIHQCYNGLFIYNVYQALQLCGNSVEMLKKTCYEHSSTLAVLCQLMVEFVLKLVPELAGRTLVVQSKTNNVVKARKNMHKELNNPVDNDAMEETGDQEDESDFYDVNNPFSRLMLAK